MGRPTKAERQWIVQRRNQAIRLRIQGRTWQQVADELGYYDKGAAHGDVKRGYEAALAEQRRSIEELREQDLDAVGQLMQKAWAVLEREHVMVSHGRIVRDEGGDPIRDDGPKLAAIDRLIKLHERRAKLLGLDAPVKVQGDHVITEVRPELLEKLRALRVKKGEPAGQVVEGEVVEGNGHHDNGWVTERHDEHSDD